MILDFTISNFRSIKDAQTISFEATDSEHLEDYYVVKIDRYRILKIATILGANASGKSNVLRAFALLSTLMLYPCENKQSKIEYDKFALDPECAVRDSQMIVNFICGNQKYRYEVHFNNERVSYEQLMRHPFGGYRAHKVFERSINEENGVSTIKWGDKYRSVVNTRALSVNLLQNRTVFGAYQNSNVDIPWMKEIIDWAGSYILPIVTPAEQHLTDYVTKLIYDKVIEQKAITRQLARADIGISDMSLDVETKNIPQRLVERILSDDSAPESLKAKVMADPTTKRFTVHLFHEGHSNTVPFDFSEESGGTERYYQLSGILLRLIKESHFVTIDELECRLHPDLYEHFIATYLSNSKNSQMVFTTHMREFLADKDMFRDDCVWFTEKNDEGATDLYSLADFGSDVLRDSTSRYNVYRAGRLGGVPRLQDTYIG